MERTRLEFGFLRQDLNDNSFEFIVGDTIDGMFTEISKYRCFADYDDSFRIIKIIAWGKEVEYVGWQPDMHYEYRFVENKELAWEGWFPQWEH
jgi:hypothetical protein